MPASRASSRAGAAWSQPSRSMDMVASGAPPGADSARRGALPASGRDAFLAVLAQDPFHAVLQRQLVQLQLLLLELLLGRGHGVALQLAQPLFGTLVVLDELPETVVAGQQCFPESSVEVVHRQVLLSVGDPFPGARPGSGNPRRRQARAHPTPLTP